MTVHMFRVMVGRGSMPVSDLDQRLNDWVTSNGEWTDDNVPHTLMERNTKFDGTGDVYHQIDVRFVPDNTKDNLLQKLTDKLDNKVAWYRVGYHACTHREGDGSSGPCDWDDTAEWTEKGTAIPEGVPTFDVV